MCRVLKRRVVQAAHFYWPPALCKDDDEFKFAAHDAITRDKSRECSCSPNLASYMFVYNVRELTFTESRRCAVTIGFDPQTVSRLATSFYLSKIKRVIGYNHMLHLTQHRFYEPSSFFIVFLLH